ncbi:MAG: response regulator [Deltaproteobacteria bacterium]|nr:response regulator [Deltaproteobacteria bacterium]
MNTSQKRRILVVDDESILRMLLSDVLSEAGYAVDTAENGIHALEQLKKAAKYDLIITDMSMPGMDGISLCRKARQDFPALKHKFLFLSGNMGDEALSFSRENGNKYMTKPFKTLDLLKEINAMLQEEEVAATEDVLWKTGTDRRVEDRFSWYIAKRRKDKICGRASGSRRYGQHPYKEFKYAKGCKNYLVKERK